MSLQNDDNLLPISALQHLLFCPRQVALIHIERLWVDNVLTVKGQLLHRRADRPAKRRRPPIPAASCALPRSQSLEPRVVRALPLRCGRLGLWGKADVVEFEPSPDAGSTPFPVEYKRGRPKANRCDEVQLCAQALCLEEMLGCRVPAGALYYGKTRRRKEVLFDTTLRALTESAAAELHRLVASGVTPPPRYERRKCDRCSLKPLCLPERTSIPSRASGYVALSLAEATSSTPPPADPVSPVSPRSP
jgi:CRISPR-associated exonuclease Cas4